MSDKLRDALQLASKELHNASSNEGTRAEVADAIDAALSAEPEKCVYHKQIDIRIGTYVFITSCGYEIFKPTIDHWHFCPFKGCGREIEVRDA